MLFRSLDEPTNHLDIASREWIESALSDYTEALLFVSHDRYFIENFAERIWALEDGKISDYRGGYKEYLSWRERQAVTAAAVKTAVKNADPRKPRQKNTARELARTEREIERLEAKQAELDKQAEEFSTDYQKLMEIDEEKAALDAELEQLYERWEALKIGRAHD